jgi:hypothetical protein
VVLYQNVALDGVGVEAVVRRFWELEVLRLQYLYVGLPGLDAERYVRGDNWLGVGLSALMRMPPERAGELGLEALRRLKGAGLNDQQEFLLSECVEAYLPVETPELDRIRGIIAGESATRAPAVQRNKTTGDLLWEKGVAEGRRTARLEMLEAMLATKFGPLTAEHLTSLRAKSDDDLVAIGKKVMTAATLADLGL